MASLNYARGVPNGNNNVPFQGLPAAVKAIARYVYENGTASSVITLSDNTTAIEISGGASTTVAAVMRWVPVGEGTSAPFASVIAIAGATANYDHVIPPSTVRRFVVPIEVNNPQGYSSQVGLNIENGLYRRVAIKTQGVASVLLTEYGNSNNY